MKDSAFSVPSPPPASLRTIMKSQEQQPASASPPAPASEKPALDTNVVENGNNQEGGPCAVLVLTLFLMVDSHLFYLLCSNRW